MFIRKYFFYLLGSMIILGLTQTSLHADPDCEADLFLTDTDGVPIIAPVDYELHFYASESSTTDLVTPITQRNVTPENGLIPFTFTCGAELMSNPSIYMEFIIDGETLSPRQLLASVPYAAVAFSVADDSIALGTNTTGNYVANLSAGSGISITGSNGEASTLVISATGSSTLSAGSVTASEIADGTIATADLADGSVTTPKLASDAVTSAKILDGTITGSDIALPLTLSGNLTVTGTSTTNTLTATTGTITTGTVTTLTSTTATVGTLNVTTLNRTCGAGTVSAGDYCIETTDRAATTWFTASETCQTANGQLCSITQLHASCADSAALGVTINKEEWSSNVSGINQIITLNAGADCETFLADNPGQSKAYRCCFSK